MTGIKREEHLVLLDQPVVPEYLDKDIQALGLTPIYLRSADAEKKLPWLRSLAVKGVYCLNEASKFREYDLASALGSSPVSKEVLTLGRDKHALRKRLAINSLPYFFIPTGARAGTPPLRFPFIVKPSSGYASAGVQLVRDQAGFEKAVLRINRLNKLVFDAYSGGETGCLCEQYVDGQEVSADSITVNGRTRVFGVCTRAFAQADNFQDFAYFMDLAGTETLQGEIQDVISAALNMIGYRNGPTHIELRRSSETGQWHILDLAFRVGAMGHIGELIRCVSGIRYNQLAMRAWLGTLTEDDLLGERASARNHGLMFIPYAGSGGVVREYLGEEYLASEKAVRYFSFSKTAGERLIPYPAGADYAAFILGVAATAPALEELYRELQKRVKVIYE